MALDGITVAALTAELNQTILNGRISKIAQPEADELLLTIKASSGQYRLSLSASASLPYIYLTAQNKVSPMTAPNFCMVLRKHIANGRIIDISQPGLERIIRITVEHLDEMGDLKKKNLIIELMGKYSNIIFCDENERIIDSCREETILSLRLRTNGIPLTVLSNSSVKRQLLFHYRLRKHLPLLLPESAVRLQQKSVTALL